MRYRELKKEQRKKLFFTLFIYLFISILLLGYASFSLHTDKYEASVYWDKCLNEDPALSVRIEQVAADNDAVRVSVGTALENVESISLRENKFHFSMKVWFRWDGHDTLDPVHNFMIYRGVVHNLEMISEEKVGETNYQICRINASITKNYGTKLFPLDSHQIRVYIEPDFVAEEVLLVPDVENSYIAPNLNVSGYRLVRNALASVPISYQTTHGSPKEDGEILFNEIVTAIEINRDGWGLYVKCFIALFGTLIWSMIALFICAEHRVDPLSMLPGALFGTVSNILVGANLVPDALQSGLLEYINIWGIVSILSIALIIININNSRIRMGEKEFAHFYGKVMFWVVGSTILFGNILLPAIVIL